MRKWLFFLLIIVVVLFLMRGGKQEVKNLNNSGPTIVAFGDSLTQGVGAPDGNAFTDFLAPKVNMPVINLGQSGQTGADAPARIEDVLVQNPYMVLIEFGANDLMRGVNFAQTVAAISTIVDRVQNAGAIAVIVDTGGSPAMGGYTKAYKQIAAEKNAVFVPAILDGVFGRPQYMADPIHPNAAGYQIVADKIYKGILPYLKK